MKTNLSRIILIKNSIKETMYLPCNRTCPKKCVYINYDEEYDIVIDIKYNNNSMRYLGVT